MYQKTHGNDSNYYDIRKTFEYNPMVIVHSEAEALNKVSEGRHLLLFSNDDTVSYTISTYCDLTILDVSFKYWSS